MTTTSKRALDLKYEGNFLHLKFQTVKGVDEGGNSEHPSTLTFYIEQMQNVVIDKTGSTVTMEFVGQQEFFEFHDAIRLLAKELDAAYEVRP